MKSMINNIDRAKGPCGQLVIHFPKHDASKRVSWWLGRWSHERFLLRRRMIGFVSVFCLFWVFMALQVEGLI